MHIHVFLSFLHTCEIIAAQLPEGMQHPAEGDELLMSVIHSKISEVYCALYVSLLLRSCQRGRSTRRRATSC